MAVYWGSSGRKVCIYDSWAANGLLSIAHSYVFKFQNKFTRFVNNTLPRERSTISLEDVEKAWFIRIEIDLNDTNEFPFFSFSG